MSKAYAFGQQHFFVAQPCLRLGAAGLYIEE